jgi:hypothetical protein
MLGHRDKSSGHKVDQYQRQHHNKLQYGETEDGRAMKRDFRWMTLPSKDEAWMGVMEACTSGIMIDLSGS